MKKKAAFIFLFFISTVVWLPILLITGNSFLGEKELIDKFGAVLFGTTGTIKFSILPQYPTLRPYVELLLEEPGFPILFWNSCKQVFGILAGTCLVSLPAAWALSQYEFAGRKIWTALYTILMLLPFQVTMLSDYFVLDRLRLLDTHFALILPGVFAAFPVFILTKFFQAVPKELLDAARVEGAGEVRIFIKIGLPLLKEGILSVFLLCFFESWNAIEQPLTFLKTDSLKPMSLYLPGIIQEKAGIAFSASLIAMIPPFLLFLSSQQFLEQGITAAGLKE